MRKALWSFAPHDISMILSLIGEEPVDVVATGSSFLHPGIADVTTTHLRFAGGAAAHVFVSWLVLSRSSVWWWSGTGRWRSSMIGSPGVRS